jgi:hypothetical protein
MSKETKWSYGDKTKEWIWQLIEILFDQVKKSPGDRTIECEWQYKDSDRPKIVVITKKRLLLSLLPKSANKSGTVDKKFRNAINYYLRENFLGILTSNRGGRTQGVEEWRFTLELWSSFDKAKNKAEFNKRWAECREAKIKSGVQQIETDSEDTEDEDITENHLEPDHLPTPRNNCFHLGIKDQKYFLGRDATLAELHDLLQERGKVAVSGMGGIGKTELMLQYAKQYQQQYPKGLCWVSAAAEQDIAAQIMAFTQENFSNFQPNPELRADSKIRLCWEQWLEQPPDGKMLLMIDDVSGPDYENKIKPYLPQKLQQIPVLLTTREKYWQDFGMLSLSVLHSDEALNLLKVRVGEDRINEQLEDAERLCKWLGYLPLGLELVAHYLAELSYLSIAKLLCDLQKRGRGLKHDALRREKNQPWTITAKRGVAAAFDLSWERLDPPEQHLGLLLSLFAPTEIPWELVEKTEVNYCEKKVSSFDPAQLLTSRHILRRLHLINDSGKTVSLHQLIRQFFREKMEVYNVN